MATAPSSAPHTHREIAESFGGDAARYDRTRPRYPRELAEQVLAGLPGRRVLDVGIGTGLSALPFAECGADVLGVEVDERMAEVARSRGIRVEVARFEQWDDGGERFDAVVSGQTWHWIDPDAGARRAGELLRPGGRFAAFWNVGDPAPEVAAAFAEVYRSVETGLPFTPYAVPTAVGYDRVLTPARDALRSAEVFSEPGELRLGWDAVITRDAWLEQVPTMGGHQQIPADRLAELLDRLGAVVDDHGGAFTMHYETVALVADRVGA